MNNLVNVSITGSKPLPSLASLSLMLSGVEAKDKSQDDVSGGTLQKQERHVLKMNTPHTKKDGFGAVSDDSLFYRSPHYGVDWELMQQGIDRRQSWQWRCSEMKFPANPKSRRVLAKRERERERCGH